jgi:hypothetical protein
MKSVSSTLLCRIGKTECKSLDEIIFKFKADLNLLGPCPGSPFLELFKQVRLFFVLLLLLLHSSLQARRDALADISDHCAIVIIIVIVVGVDQDNFLKNRYDSWETEDSDHEEADLW